MKIGIIRGGVSKCAARSDMISRLHGRDDGYTRKAIHLFPAEIRLYGIVSLSLESDGPLYCGGSAVPAGAEGPRGTLEVGWPWRIAGEELISPMMSSDCRTRAGSSYSPEWWEVEYPWSVGVLRGREDIDRLTLWNWRLNQSPLLECREDELARRIWKTLLMWIQVVRRNEVPVVEQERGKMTWCGWC